MKNLLSIVVLLTVIYACFNSNTNNRHNNMPALTHVKSQYQQQYGSDNI